MVYVTKRDYTLCAAFNSVFTGFVSFWEFTAIEFIHRGK